MLDAAFDDVLRAAQAGAAWALTRLYEDLGGAVTGYLRLQGAHEPDDVASETFLSVFRGLGDFTGDESDFRSWVFTIAHRRLIDERRQRSRRVLTEELDHDLHAPIVDGPEETVIGRISQDELHRLIGTLSEGQRDTLLLRIVAGMSLEETATVLGRRIGAIKQLQRRGLLALRKEISAERVTK